MTVGGVSAGVALAKEARSICAEAEIVDLHLDTLIANRLFGYDPLRRHGTVLGGRFMSHADLPRLQEGGVTGALWSITTNPLRSQAGRCRALGKNLDRLRGIADRSGGKLVVAGTHAAYRAARRDGGDKTHVALPSIQGGHALAPAPPSAPMPDPELVRVTLLHLTSSWVGATSTPLRLGPAGSLSDAGCDLVRRLDRHGVLVDLAHIHPRAFWRAVEVHDPEIPLVVTHTGVSGVTPHWRNLDDRQLEAIARTDGVIGVIFQTGFLTSPRGPTDAGLVVDHLEHIISVCGEDCAAIGTDHDGMVTPPRGLRSAECWPQLVEAMLARGFSRSRIDKVLGENFLRVLARVRP